MGLPGQAAEVKRTIGYVPEAAELYESLTSQEYLELVGPLHHLDEPLLQTRIRALLDVFDASAEARYPPRVW